MKKTLILFPLFFLVCSFLVFAFIEGLPLGSDVKQSWFGVADLYLVENYCHSVDCYSEFTLVPQKDFFVSKSLVNFVFVGVQKLKSYDFFEKLCVQFPVYSEGLNLTVSYDFGVSVNGSYEREIKNYTSFQYISSYRDYCYLVKPNLFDFSKGVNRTFVLKGNVKPDSLVDWVLDIAGFKPNWAWWNTSVEYYRNVSCADVDSQNHNIGEWCPVYLNTASLVSSGKMQGDCDDLYAVIDGVETEINITSSLVSSELSCNKSRTLIWINMTTVVSSGTNQIIQLYYGDDDAGKGKRAGVIYSRINSNVNERLQQLFGLSNKTAFGGSSGDNGINGEIILLSGEGGTGERANQSHVKDGTDGDAGYDVQNGNLPFWIEYDLKSNTHSFFKLNTTIGGFNVGEFCNYSITIYNSSRAIMWFRRYDNSSAVIGNRMFGSDLLGGVRGSIVGFNLSSCPNNAGLTKEVYLWEGYTLNSSFVTSEIEYDSNSAPSLLISTDVSRVFSNTNVNISFTYIDSDLDEGNITLNSSLNGVVFSTMNKLNLSNGTYGSFFVDSLNWTNQGNLTLSIYATDGSLVYKNYSYFNISNNPPNLTFYYDSELNFYGNESFWLNISVNDFDTDNVTFSVNFTVNGTDLFSFKVYNVSSSRFYFDSANFSHFDNVSLILLAYDYVGMFKNTSNFTILNNLPLFSYSLNLTDIYNDTDVLVSYSYFDIDFDVGSFVFNLSVNDSQKADFVNLTLNFSDSGSFVLNFANWSIGDNLSFKFWYKDIQNETIEVLNKTILVHSVYVPPVVGSGGVNSGVVVAPEIIDFSVKMLTFFKENAFYLWLNFFFIVVGVIYILTRVSKKKNIFGGLP